MTYTRAWDKNRPLGTAAASNIDDEIRFLREDIEERIALILAGWNTATPTDPITFVSGCIITDAVADQAITTVKLADFSVTSIKLAPGAVPTEIPVHVAQATYDGSSASVQGVLDILSSVGLIEVS